MKYGYTGIINGHFVFVIAKNRSEAKARIRQKANGQEWELDESKHYKTI